MKLLTKSVRRGRVYSKNSVIVSNTVLSISESIQNKYNMRLGMYAAAGLNDDNEFCIYFSKRRIDGFKKLTNNGNNAKRIGFAFNKSDQRAMKHYKGDYKPVEYGLIKVNANIYEMALKKEI